jgi:hypothetical protein
MPKRKSKRYRITTKRASPLRRLTIETLPSVEEATAAVESLSKRPRITGRLVEIPTFTVKNFSRTPVRSLKLRVDPITKETVERLEQDESLGRLGQLGRKYGHVG